MKKLAALLLLLPVAVITIAGAANAQRKNTTVSDVKPACACQGQKDCQCANLEKAAKHKMKKHEDKKHKKDQKDHDKKTKSVTEWPTEQTEELNEKYADVLKKIEKAEISPENAAKLQKIAADNKAAAEKNINAAAKQIQKSHSECMAAGGGHKLCKRISKLLILED